MRFALLCVLMFTTALSSQAALTKTDIGVYHQLPNGLGQVNVSTAPLPGYNGGVLTLESTVFFSIERQQLSMYPGIITSADITTRQAGSMLSISLCGTGYFDSADSMIAARLVSSPVVVPDPRSCIPLLVASLGFVLRRWR
jgi:hypothetical protein